MSHVVVTGASGLVGANLVRDLLREGRPVRALVHTDTRALQGLPVEQVRCDVRDARAVADAVAGADVVYHLAACISVGQYAASDVAAVNVGGTENRVQACLRQGVGRLVHFSSIHACDRRPDDGTVDERRALVPDAATCSSYDRSMALGERVVQAAVAGGLDAVVVVPTAVIGPYDFKPSYLGGVIAKLARGGQPVLVTGGFDWVDVRDVSAGARAAEARGRRGERYLLSGRWCSVEDLAAAIDEITGRERHRLTIPSGVAREAFAGYARALRLVGRSTAFTPEAVEALQHHRWVSHAKASRELGYRPRPLRETLADTIAWMDGRWDGAPA